MFSPEHYMQQSNLTKLFQSLSFEWFYYFFLKNGKNNNKFQQCCLKPNNPDQVTHRKKQVNPFFHAFKYTVATDMK